MEEIPMGIARFLGRLLADVFLVYTGEAVLFVVTLGRRKPSWDLYADEPAGRFVVFTEISFWIGAALDCGCGCDSEVHGLVLTAETSGQIHTAVTPAQAGVQNHS